MNHLPKSEQRTLRTSWITYDDLLKSMEKKRKLQSKMVSFCGYLIFIISVCVTSVLAVHSIERYQYANSIKRTFSVEYFKNSAEFQHSVKNFESLTTKQEYLSWFFDSVKNKVMIREDRILDNSHILLWGIHLRSRRYAETDGCSIPDTVSTALSLTHGCFRGMEYKQCLVLADGTSYMSAHTWNDKNSLGIGTLKGHLRDKYSGSGFILPFDFHSTNQSISTSCTNTSSSNTVSYEELETYLNPYIVDYADSSTYGKSDLEMISTSLYTYNPSMNLFGRAFFTMEVGYGGEISVFTYVQSARIFPDYNTSELVGVVFAVISLIGGVVGTFAILRALMEAQSDPKGVVKKMGGAGKIFEAFLDIFIFLYVVATMTIYLYLFFDTSMSDKIRESLSGSISSYPIEFGEVLDWHEIIQILLVISNVLVFFRVLSFSALLDAVHEIIKAILKALSSMTTFFALVVVLVMITSYAGMYFFGGHSVDFKRYKDAFSTQWKAMGGDASVMSIVREFPILAPIFVIMCFLMFNVVLLNMGLSFFVEVWIRVVHERKSLVRNRMRDFVRLRKHNSELRQIWIACRDIVLSYLNTERLSSDEIVPRLEIWKKNFTRKYDARRAEWLNLERIKSAVLGLISEDEKELRKPRYRKLIALYEKQCEELYLYSIDHLVSSAKKNSVVADDIEEKIEEEKDDEENEIKKKMKERRKQRPKREMIQRSANDSEHGSLKSMFSSPEDIVNTAELKELQNAIAELRLLQQKRNSKMESSIRAIMKENSMMRKTLSEFERKLGKFSASSSS